MKKILFVGAEALPFAATGGLGDVLGSLPAALAAEGADVRVVMPLYAAVSPAFREQMEQVAVLEVPLAWRRQYCGIFRLLRNGVTYYFIDNEYYFSREGGLYGHFDDGERYAFFCRAALEMLPHIDFYPDVLHAHDWQAALSVVYLNRHYRHISAYADMRTVFTIHNIEYQGKYDFSILGDVFDLPEDMYDVMAYDDCINLMKGAILCADRVSTVSPRYAEEIMSPEYAHGLDAILRDHAFKVCGILNGIDYGYYDPKDANSIVQAFSYRSQDKKSLNKLALQREVCLPERADVPLLTVITRLVAHKGIDLISQMIRSLVASEDVQLVVLGMGESCYENLFAELQYEFPQKVAALLTYDRALAKRIYAASDIFLMPSRSEPCGLAQMIASRYGAIPVVRETGGLFDSIKGYWEDGRTIHGNGFTFAGYTPEELDDRVRAALALWRDEPRRRRLVSRIMRTDFSWTAAAKQYLSMYEAL